MIAITQNVSARALKEDDLPGAVRVLNREAIPLLRKLRSLAVLNFAETFGDGAASTYTLTHGLGTADLVWSIRHAATGLFLDTSSITSVTATETEITVVLVAPAGVNAIRLVAIGL